MDVASFVSHISRWVPQGTGALYTLGRWWLSELLATIPSGLSNWLLERGARILVLAPGDGTVAFHLMSDRRRVLTSAYVNQGDYSPDLIDTFLNSHNQQRKGVSIGIRMPTGCIFFRSLLLPREVRRSLDAVVAQDMTSKTPFQIHDVYHGHTARSLGDAIGVRQWIVRRKHVNSKAHVLGIDLNDLTFIEPQPENDEAEPLPTVNLREPTSDPQRWIFRTSLSLAVAALLLACVAAGLRHGQQQALLDSLEAEVVAARSKAQQTLTAMKDLERDKAGLERIRLKRRAEPGLLDVWEETTRLLPNHSWLTELRFSETAGSRQVVMTGFSRAAAALVPLVDRSALFSDASLIAPISLDQAEERERFAIQANVRTSGKSRTASK